MLVQVKKHDYSEFPQFFPKQEKALKFKTKLEIYDVSLTGILVVKRESDKSVLVSFVNEFGIKYFDARINNLKPEMIYCVNKLDKKIITNVLLHDLAVLFLPAAEKHSAENVELGKFVYRYTQNNSNLLEVDEFNKNKKTSTILMENNGEVSIRHTAPKMALVLKPI